MFTFTAEESVIIEQPIEEVFAFISDCENDIQWSPAVKKMEQISGNGPGQGARYRMQHTPGGMKFEATVEVVACEPPRLLKWVTTDSGHTIRGTYELVRANGSTRLRQTSQITLEGWLRIPGLLMKRFIARDVQKELGKQFANLKRILESQPAGAKVA